MKNIKIFTDYIKLDSFFKLIGKVSSGGEARAFISEKKVKVNGEVCTQRGKKLREGDRIDFENQEYVVNHSEDL